MYSFAYNSATTRPVLTNCVLFGNGGANAIVTSSLAVVTASFSLFEAGVTGFTDGGNNIIGVTTSPRPPPNAAEAESCRDIGGGGADVAADADVAAAVVVVVVLVDPK